MEQGTPEWLQARLGIPTSSCFHRILTAKTLKLSAQATTYMHELLAEWFLREPVSDIHSGWMERGSEQEQQAREWYEFDHNCDVEQVGFITNDEGFVGCSPDGLVGDDGGVEFKVPSAKKHVGYLLGEPNPYLLQIQGCLWITGREWWDFVSYNSEMVPLRDRIERDETMIAAIDKAMVLFCENMEAARQRMLDAGCVRRVVDDGEIAEIEARIKSQADENS